MADEKVVQFDCPQRVAYDLMVYILSNANDASSGTKKDILTVYYQSLSAVHFHNPESILQSEKPTR